MTGSAGAPSAPASSSRAPATSCPALGQLDDLRAVGHQITGGAAGIGEERHRRRGRRPAPGGQPGQLLVRPARPGSPAAAPRGRPPRPPSGPGGSRPAAGPRSRRSIRLAARRPRSLSAAPPSSRSDGALPRRVRATASITSGPAGAGGTGGKAAAGVPPGPQDTSAGSTSVAICPPSWPLAAMARTASAARPRVVPAVCTQPETVRAAASMSECSGASKRAWPVACAPTTTTIGLCARRALCRLASPLDRPGPRWSRTDAGRPAMRAYPSAAPVATPSNRASTPRMAGTESRAWTKCISEVPGLVKHTSRPAPTRVVIRACAPVSSPCSAPALSSPVPR